ncbi:hypothetical protein HF086_012861 [Spodoptera exigua]|uniref:Aminopeptidase n=1 Tax=Spodoptera exigua TaxID=7107 RepID=A0A922MUX3_SPOEX|nr:hypothetical protein HF086_012861 [Spodoptera exigua]
MLCNNESLDWCANDEENEENTMQGCDVPIHIIKTRSIDLNNAHGLSMETRLDKVVEPTGYKLDLEPYLEDGLFKGHVAINVTWLMDGNEINVHCAHEIEILESEVRAHFSGDTKESKRVTINKLSLDPKKPIVTLSLERTVPKGSTGVLKFSFKGNLETSSTEAFFKTTYVTEQEVERIVAATQLRPNNARRMFPCFDEPGYKTPFELSVVRPRDMIALSNVPVARTENIPDEPDAVCDHFEKTPPMSTFTLGLVIANLKQLGNSTQLKDNSGNDIEIRVWGRPEYLEALEGINDKVVRVFKELAAFWRVPLPLKRESDLSSRGYIQLAQELSYQWLGALTTPAWWTDAHLNKALVGYVAAATAFKINNGSEMEGKWPLTVLYSLYYEFSKRYPHSRITGMKQETACTKIELLFRIKFKTFSGDDIWNALNAAAREASKIPQGVDIKTMTKSWIEKDRLPLLNVQRHYNNNTAVVTQKVYLRERPHDVPEAAKMSWWLPVVIAEESTLDLKDTTPAAWMKDRLYGFSAPYPVNYDQDNWNLLSNFLQSDKRNMIPELTRAKLLHDAWNLAYAGELSFVTAFNMTLFLKNERHHLVWDPVFTMIDHLGRHICQCLHGKFQAYVRVLLSPLYEELAKDEKEDEEPWRKHLRSLTKTFLCQAGLANQYICPVFKWGTMKEWEFGLQRVINFPPSRKQSERTYLLKTLAGCPESEEKINRLLNITLLEGHANFTETDAFLIFSMLTGSATGYTTLFHFLSNNWDLLKERYSTRTNLWDNLITSATSQFTTEEGLELVSQLYVTHQGQFASAEHIIEKSMRNIREEAKWSAENLPVIEAWLDKYLASSGVKDDKFIHK